MPSDILVDTNVLVYEYDRRDPGKHARARKLMSEMRRTDHFFLSTQTLAEFHWTVTRKLPDPLPSADACRQVEEYARVAHVVPVNVITALRALIAVERHQLPVWDAQIWAAANLAGCPIVLSEGFSHHQTLDGVTFLNPFAQDFDLREVLI